MAAERGAAPDPARTARRNRLAGLALVLAGLGLAVLVVPAHTETVGYGWLRPATLPTLAAALTALAGLALAVWPRGRIDAEARVSLRVAGYLALSGVALLAMTRLGYLAAMPAFGLVVMLATGERRWLWLAAGAGLLPLALWAIVVLVLGRPLP